MTPQRDPHVERAVELVTAAFDDDVLLMVDLLLSFDSQTEMAYTLSATARIAKIMIERLARKTGNDPLELWQHLSAQAAVRYLEDG